MDFMLCFFALIFGSVCFFALMIYYAGSYEIPLEGMERLWGKQDFMQNGEKHWDLMFMLLAVAISGWLWWERLYRLSGVFNYWVFLLLLLIAWLDYRRMVIPNALNLAILLLGLAAVILTPHSLLLWKRVLGLFIISIPFAGINKVYPGGFGGGDIKLVAAAGFFMGWRRIVRGTVYGSFLAAGIFLFLFACHKLSLKDKIPFGPYLCMGIMLTFFA